MSTLEGRVNSVEQGQHEASVWALKETEAKAVLKQTEGMAARLSPRACCTIHGFAQLFEKPLSLTAVVIRLSSRFGPALAASPLARS